MPTENLGCNSDHSASDALAAVAEQEELAELAALTPALRAQVVAFHKALTPQ